MEIDLKTDSRKVKPGDTFIAIRNVNRDGHDYISQAIKNGATRVIVEEGNYDVETVVVKDTRAYLKDYLYKHYYPYFKDMKNIAYLSSYPDNVEITNEYAQKGLILEKVIDQLKIKKEEVIVLGDGMNDITLFERFPYSFAPSNGEKAIQEKAYQVVCSCEDGAVSEAIEYALENL